MTNHERMTEEPVDSFISRLRRYTTANYLQKREEFVHLDYQKLYEVAEEVHNESDEISMHAVHNYLGAISIQSLMLEDDEETVLKQNPELEKPYTDSDQHQILAIDSDRDLQYFLSNGVDVSFNSDDRDYLIESTDPNYPLTPQLLRGRFLQITDFPESRLAYTYHDLVDHVWLFDFLEREGIASKYSDLFDSIGSPFESFLFCKQAELVSGLGFASRRFLDPASAQHDYVESPEKISEVLKTVSNGDDERTRAVIDGLSSDTKVANWASFVIKDVFAQLADERKRWGTVKVLNKQDDGTLQPDTILPLLDERYMSFLYDAVAALENNQETYRKIQIGLNFSMEKIVRDFLYKGVDEVNMQVRDLATASNVDLDINSGSKRWLEKNLSMSTSNREISRF